jgi:hypothetical protein
MHNVCVCACHHACEHSYMCASVRASTYMVHIFECGYAHMHTCIHTYIYTNREQLEGMLCGGPLLSVNFDDYSRDQISAILDTTVPAAADVEMYR